jgi:hypothetical protein
MVSLEGSSCSWNMRVQVWKDNHRNRSEVWQARWDPQTKRTLTGYTAELYGTLRTAGLVGDLVYGRGAGGGSSTL